MISPAGDRANSHGSAVSERAVLIELFGGRRLPEAGSPLAAAEWSSLTKAPQRFTDITAQDVGTVEGSYARASRAGRSRSVQRAEDHRKTKTST